MALRSVVLSRLALAIDGASSEASSSVHDGFGKHAARQSNSFAPERGPHGIKHNAQAGFVASISTTNPILSVATPTA